MVGLHTILYAFLAVLFYQNILKGFYAKGNNTANSTVRSKLAGKIKNHQLLADILDSTTVESELDCMLKCVRRTGCMSFDMTLAKEAPYLWKCYLLSSQHNKDTNTLVAKQGYYHYYFENEHNLSPPFSWQGKSDEASNEVSHWRITTSNPKNHVNNINWTVDTSGGINGAKVELRGLAGIQFILHTPGLDPSTGNVSFELAGYPAKHYVVAESSYLMIRVYEDTEDFRRKATFTRQLLPSKPGYEKFMFQGSTVYNNPDMTFRLQYKSTSMYPGDIYWFKAVP